MIFHDDVGIADRVDWYRHVDSQWSWVRLYDWHVLFWLGTYRRSVAQSVLRQASLDSFELLEFVERKRAGRYDVGTRVEDAAQ